MPHLNPTGLPLGHHWCRSQDHEERAQQHGQRCHGPQRKEGVYTIIHRINVLGANGIQSFDTEMQSFFLLFNRFLTERAKGEKL
jgi:hypothetical protein